MDFRFVKASPCRNTTVFVEDEVPAALRARVARLAMAEEALAAEQVGWLVPPRDSRADVRLEMAGGEFCGNASLALGALWTARGHRAEGAAFLVECSGMDEPLTVAAERVSEGRWRGSLSVPLTAKARTLTLRAGGAAYRGAAVELSGICHFCVEAERLSGAVYDALLDALSERVASDAYGVIPYRAGAGGGYAIRPYVGVRAAQSRVFEQACGSGSIALGYWLRQSEGIVRAAVRQPGGVIEVETGEVSRISEEVYFPCEGTFFVDSAVLENGFARVGIK